MLAAALGLAAILHSGAVAFQALKLAGAGYLLYLAYATWRERQLFAVQSAPVAASAPGLVLKAVLLNFLNPKLSIFFLAFLPQFIAPDAATPLARMILLGGVFMAMTFAVFVLYAILADQFRRVVGTSRRVQTWLRYGFAATFAGLGVKLALTER